MKGVISLWGERYPCTVIEQGKIMVVTEDIGGRPCPEGTKRYFKENRGVWAECRKAAATGRWNLMGSAILFLNPTKNEK